MNTSKLLLCLILCLFAATTVADNKETAKIVQLEQELKKEVKAREALNATVQSQKKTIAEQVKAIDTLKATIEQNTARLQAASEKLGIRIDNTNTSLGTKADSAIVKSRTLWGGALLGLLALMGCLVYALLHRRISQGNASIEALRQKAEDINEDILTRFTSEMAEMQKISSALDVLAKSPQGDGGTATDHSLIKTLADRITFMEMTLYKMDPKVKGFKQLSKSISQMKDNLLANGYELVEMLGKPYNDGMKVIANFIEDEELDQGKQIITGIIKPQINYKGQMIQAAQITVSQNI